MSYNLGQLTVCPTIQDDLNRFFPRCPVNEYMPFMEWLTSPINTRGLRQTVSPGGGKVKTVTVTYTPRSLESGVQEDVANPNCNVTNFIGDRFQDYAIDTDDNVGDGFSMTPEELAYACKSNADYFIERLMDKIDVIERKLASKHTPEIAAFMGNWASNVTTNGSGELVLQTIQENGNFNPFLISKLKQALNKTGYCPERYVFGGTTLDDWFMAVVAGCCSQEGIDVGEIFRRYGVAFGYDRRFELAFGANDGVAISAGALQLLTYNRSGWTTGMPSNYIDMGNEIYVTIISPRFGIPMDLSVTLNCGKIMVWLVATTKMVGMPADMFYQGDFMEGVTYVAPLTVDNS